MGLFSGQQRLGVAAALLAASAFLSRLMGLVRDKIISWQFGAGHEADMYFAAFVVPDIINYLLAGGFMSITIIPLLARAFEKDRQDAWRLFSAIFCCMTFASCALTLGGELLARPLARVVAPGFAPEQSERLAFFMRIILPGQIFFLTGACFTALLFLRRQFAAPALSPLIYNGCIILAGLCLPLLSGKEHGMTGYCIGVTIGAFFGAFLLPLAVAAREKMHLSLLFWHPGLKRFFLIALPLMLGQTVVMLDEQFLRIFGSMLEEGTVSLLNYGRRIAQVPVSLMGQAIAVASYPFLVRLLAENRESDFNKTLNSALGAALALIIPTSLWMAAAAAPILGIIFEGGRFGAAETAACAPLARILLLPGALWIVYMTLARAYYAYEDTLTPAITGTIITLIIVPCYYWLALPIGAWGIALVSGLGLGVYVLWLALIWIKRHGRDAFTGLGSLILRVTLCSLPAAICAWWLGERVIPHLGGFSPFSAYLLELCASIAAFSVIFLPLAWLIAPEFIRNVWIRLNRRRSKKSSA